MPKKPDTLKISVAVLANEIKNMRSELTYFTQALHTNSEKDEIYRKVTTENKTAIKWIWGALIIIFGAVSTVFAFLLK